MVEIIFLMLVLKLPILYLIGVVWWAVRAEPPPPEPALLPVADENEPPLSPRRFRPPSPRRSGPERRDRAARRSARLPVR
ncbi:MAG TPA: hypothetical protein VHH31_02715 [Gaiellaceae bacterium]|nr:hypothetical protein [Gaiellaceae bacterium]